MTNKAGMDRNARVHVDMQVQIIKALAHVSRLFILEELRSHEQCVQDLAQSVGAHISTTSKHLLLLKTAGLVKRRKEGTRVFYSLSQSCVLDVLDCIESVCKVRLRVE